MIHHTTSKTQIVHVEMDKQTKMISVFLLICLCYNTLANENKSCDCELLQVYDQEDPNEFTCEQNITVWR